MISIRFQMAGALAAFFGCPLGGSLFAMEVNSRWGVEYFEHTVEAIFCGEVCLAVFRALARLPIRPIWNLGVPPLDGATPMEICWGAGLGLLGGLVAALFNAVNAICVFIRLRTLLLITNYLKKESSTNYLK